MDESLIRRVCELERKVDLQDGYIAAIIERLEMSAAMTEALNAGGAVKCVHCAREQEHYMAWVVRFERDFGPAPGVMEFYCGGDAPPGYVVGERYSLTVNSSSKLDDAGKAVKDIHGADLSTPHDGSHDTGATRPY